MNFKAFVFLVLLSTAATVPARELKGVPGAFRLAMGIVMLYNVRMHHFELHVRRGMCCMSPIAKRVIPGGTSHSLTDTRRPQVGPGQCKCRRTGDCQRKWRCIRQCRSSGHRQW